VEILLPQLVQYARDYTEDKCKCKMLDL